MKEPKIAGKAPQMETLEAGKTYALVCLWQIGESTLVRRCT